MSQAKPTILVTGGAGYIGSPAVLALQRAGYSVIVLDNLEYSHRELVEDILKVELVVGDISDRAILDRLFATCNIAAVIHFNLGNGNEFSVRQVSETAAKVTGQDIKVVECDRRLGDPPILVGSSEKAREMLGCYPQYPDLSRIISDAWQWHQWCHQ
jgi:UDP-glucose 4-epimerase